MTGKAVLLNQIPIVSHFPCMDPLWKGIRVVSPNISHLIQDAGGKALAWKVAGKDPAGGSTRHTEGWEEEQRHTGGLFQRGMVSSTKSNKVSKWQDKGQETFLETIIPRG